MLSEQVAFELTNLYIPSNKNFASSSYQTTRPPGYGYHLHSHRHHRHRSPIPPLSQHSPSLRCDHLLPLLRDPPPLHLLFHAPISPWRPESPDPFLLRPRHPHAHTAYRQCFLFPQLHNPHDTVCAKPRSPRHAERRGDKHIGHRSGVWAGPDRLPFLCWLEPGLSGLAVVGADGNHDRLLLGLPESTRSFSEIILSHNHNKIHLRACKCEFLGSNPKHESCKSIGGIDYSYQSWFHSMLVQLRSWSIVS